MIYLALALPAILLALLIAKTGDAAPAPTVRTSSAEQPPIHGPYWARIVRARDKTRMCEVRLGLDRSPVSKQPVLGAAYARWVLALWQGRAQAACRIARTLATPAGAARAVFGPYAGQALVVGRCESGLSTTAENGQYLGIWQMGSSERATYGHGDTPLEQAIAAHRYFVRSGRDWSPWSCKPDGTVQ